jgi:glycosyltransferase involved in cell wall biosynthesis
MRALYRYSHRIVAVSKGVAADLELNIGLPNNNVSVIYNPVVTSKMEELAQESLPHPWLTASSPPVVLGIGRLTYAKNFSLLIESFYDLRKEIEAKLIILGEGPDRPTLVNLISSLGLSRDVLLPGFVPNPYSFLKNCSIFVLSSRWEGLPTVLIEALACGAPVVSTDCPSGPREILQDGKLGALVPISDKLALTEAIQNGLANGPISLSKQTLAVYRTEYAVDQYERIIN